MGLFDSQGKGCTVDGIIMKFKYIKSGFRMDKAASIRLLGMKHLEMLWLAAERKTHAYKLTTLK